MGYANDLGSSRVTDLCPITGYPRNRYGYLLQTTSVQTGELIHDWDRTGTELPNWTSPYGHLEFAVGSGDDFYCFDYASVNAGPRGEFVILHTTINSEIGAFIMDHSYEVLPANAAEERAAIVRAAFGLIDAAQEWGYDNGIKHDRRGWNQNAWYFPICVAQSMFPYRFQADMNFRSNNRKALQIARAIAFDAQAAP